MVFVGVRTQAINRARAAATLIALCFLCTEITSAGKLPDSTKPDLVVTILHTNDLHAHDSPFLDSGKKVGGMAQIGHLIRSIRKSTPNVVTVDAGDIFEGTSFFKLYHGEVEVALLNLIGYEIYTPGNHEFDDGPDNLANQLAQARFNVISANLDTARAPNLDRLISQSVVKTFDGEKIAFVGATTRFLDQLSLTTGEVHIKGNNNDWIAPIKAEVERLQAEGINKIVLITHVGVDDDRRLAEALPEVDAIIGGHSHTRLNKPIVIRHGDGASTLIVQTGSNGRSLGKTRLAFDARGRLMLSKADYSLINITDRMVGDTDIQYYLDGKSGPIEALRREKAGIAAVEFDNQFASYPWDSPIGDLVCDALAERGAKYGAEIALQNRGGIRSRLEKGMISKENVEELLPFDNSLTFATITGGSLLKVLEHSLSGTLRGKFLEVHNLKLAYDPTQPPGSRLVFAFAMQEAGFWKEINPGGMYKIAINDYSFSGGEGYDFSEATDIERTKERLAVIFSSYLERHKEVAPQPPSRIVPLKRDMLAIVEHGGKRRLQLKCGVPRARLTLVAGAAVGLDPIPGSIPVPLSNPRVIKTGIRANRSGEYYWTLPLTSADSAGKADRGQAIQEEMWVAVIAHPLTKGDRLKTLISCPIRIRQREDGSAGNP